MEAHSGKNIDQALTIVLYAIEPGMMIEMSQR